MILDNENQLSSRIEALKRMVRETYSEKMSSQRKEIFERVFNENRSEPQVIRMAKGLAAFLCEKDILLYQDDLLAGYEQFYDYSVPAMGETPPVFPEEISLLEQFRKGYRIGLFGGGLGGHVIAGYDSVLERGLGSLADAARTKLKENERTDGDFACASLIVCEAATDYALRYAARAEELAQEAATEEYEKQLRRIADACQWVALNPPRSFFEAVQLLWLTHEIITCEQSSGSLSLGRLDQYLFPYYAKDIATGLLTRYEASELVEALWIKFNGMKRGFQHVVLGGCRSDGEYAANDLSYICLRATKKLRMDQPLLSVRWHPNIPESFWNEIQELIQVGMGFPALFNDEVAIAAKRRLGISKDDAENYGVVGCVELSIPGKEFSHTEGLRVNWAKVLDLMLNEGVCPVTGESMELKNKRDLQIFKSFAEFYQWYQEEFAHFVDLGIKGMNISDRNFHHHRPYPFLSSTMQGCLEKGRDVTAGSTIYNLSTVNGCGMANATNSLAAIKRMVYQEKKVSLPELTEALRSRFEGAEVLQEALTKCSKYGNDNDEADNILKDLADSFCRQIESYRNPRGGRFQTGLYTVEAHTQMGKLTGALPDGRPYGLALASGMSPSQGTDLSGPTAVIKSTTKLDHSLLGNGMVLDLKFHPTFFDNKEKRRAFKNLVETYFQLGGMEIQFNVINQETLIGAQESPDEYRDLIVRVSGFSAYFIDLDKVTQNEIIARTEHYGI
ncbi:hypothetical protein H8E77_10700 [bacterium]|nr:hypothetical protein [bacterium]